VDRETQGSGGGAGNERRVRPAIPRLRWWIGGLLFASTVINYIDRQALSVLAPFLKSDYHWTNSDFALLIISFRVAYAVMQSVAGRVLDWLGTRRGLLLSVAWYSIAAIMTATAQGLRSFMAFRFLLGAGEAANWPGATKAVAEWFPKSERGWAVALFDSGSAIGAAVAPALVVGLYHAFGSWRPVFVITGMLGFSWMLVFRRFYYTPETHPRLSADERNYILSGRAEDGDRGAESSESWFALLRMRQTWGIILGRTLTDPVWFFVADWFAIYLVSKGFRLENALVGFWVPFLAADFGNFFGGGFSSHLIRRGWPVVRARKFVIVVCGIGMACLIPAAFLNHFALLIALFAISTFSYAAWSTMALTLPSDLYPLSQVATVSGMSGTGAGLGTILSTYLIGWAADHYSFQPVLVAASTVPLAATLIVCLLVPTRTAHSEPS
jgi:ACS family hexuronate transporter-like MFS transporter